MEHPEKNNENVQRKINKLVFATPSASFEEVLHPHQCLSHHLVHLSFLKQLSWQAEF
jgi:hypothetical protein